MLITYGTLLRRSAIQKAGGFNKSLRFKEDQEMGERLEKFGFVVVGDPEIKIYSSITNSFLELMERYSRWYMDINEKPSLKGYLHNIKASFRPMMQEDLKDRDFYSIFITLLLPHFQFFYCIKNFLERFRY